MKLADKLFKKISAAFKRDKSRYDIFIVNDFIYFFDKPRNHYASYDSAKKTWFISDSVKYWKQIDIETEEAIQTFPFKELKLIIFNLDLFL